MKRKFISYLVAFIIVVLISPVQGGDTKVKGHIKEATTHLRKKSQNKDRKNYSNKIISQLSDAEKKRLRELQKSDTNAFRQEIKKIVTKYKALSNKKSQEMKNLIARFHTAGDGEKAELKQKITEIIRNQFLHKMAVNKKNYEKAVKRLNELKQKLDERENNSEVIIKERVRELTKDPVLIW